MGCGAKLFELFSLSTQVYLRNTNWKEGGGKIILHSSCVCGGGGAGRGTMAASETLLTLFER